VVGDVDGAAQQGLGFVSTSSSPEKPAEAVECVGELGALAQRLEPFDGSPTGTLGVVVPGLMHQRQDETRVRPSDPTVIAECAEDLGGTTSDSLALGRGIRAPRRRGVLSDQLASLWERDVEPIGEALRLAVPAGALRAEPQRRRTAGGRPRVLECSLLEVRPPFAELI